MHLTRATVAVALFVPTIVFMADGARQPLQLTIAINSYVSMQWDCLSGCPFIASESQVLDEVERSLTIVRIMPPKTVGAPLSWHESFYWVRFRAPQPL